jgi:hypothetical protein
LLGKGDGVGHLWNLVVVVWTKCAEAWKGEMECNGYCQTCVCDGGGIDVLGKWECYKFVSGSNKMEEA